MLTVLWVDDDLDSFPAIERVIGELGGSVVAAYSISQALEWLEENEDAAVCVLLDAIVPLGDASLRKKHSDEDREYSGCIILHEFPDLSSRTIVLSIMPKKRLVPVFERYSVPEIRIFTKMTLGEGSMGSFREALDGLLEH